MARSFEELPAMIAGTSAPLDAFHATQIRAMAALFGFFVLITALRRHHRVVKAHADWRAMAALALGALLGPFIGAALFAKSLQHIAAGVTQTIVATLPVVVMPLTLWLEKDHISRRALIGDDKAMSEVTAGDPHAIENGDTIYLTVADKDRA